MARQEIRAPQVRRWRKELLDAGVSEITVTKAQLVHPGSGIVQVKQGRVSPVKFYRITDEDITAIAALTGLGPPARDDIALLLARTARHGSRAA